jgi:hypothetical protein
MERGNDINRGPMGRVTDGMHVVDAVGEDIGRVELVQIGDPQATTTAGNEDRPPGPFERVAEALGGEHEPNVPEPMRSHLVRVGYIKVDGPHLLDRHRYVSSEHVREVVDDRVVLDAPKQNLVREH